ncbi:DUF4013 domain-containing protein [Methanothermococcus sp. SCGC AD-155-E23]|nr:DUF4013 domain-containing protein [Methanothermococcus sp. SCGC AD-155-E23]
MSFIEKYLIEPFEYVSSDWSKVLIGILLSILPMVISIIAFITLYAQLNLLLPLFLWGIVILLSLLVSIILAGYYIGVIRNTLEGLDTLPDWSNIVRILIDGLLYIVAGLILLLIACLPAILLFIIGVYPILATSGSYTTYSDLWSVITLISTIIILLFLYGVIAIIVLWIYLPLATVNFAKKGFFGFFEVVEILKRFSLEYLGILVLYLVIKCIVGLILWIIAVIPIIGELIFYMFSSALSFILEIMFFRAVAKYYLERG